MRLHEEKAVIPSTRHANSCEYMREQRVIENTGEMDLAGFWALCMVALGHSRALASWNDLQRGDICPRELAQ